MDSDFQKILSIGLFPRFQVDKEQVAKWVDRTSHHLYEAGEYLAEEGKPTEHIFFVNSGEVELSISGKAYQRLEGASTVGFFSALSNDKNGQGIKAIQPTEVLRMPMKAMRDLLEENFMINQQLFQGLFEVLLNQRAKRPDGGYPKVLAPQPKLPAFLGVIERMAALSAMNEFRSINLDVVADISVDVEEIRFKKGECLWEEGDFGDYAIGIVAGSIRCKSDKREQSFELGPRDFVGMLDSIPSLDRYFDAVASSDLTGLKLPLTSLLDAFEDHFEAGMDFIAQFASDIVYYQSLNNSL